MTENEGAAGIERWELLPQASPDGRLLGSFYDQPVEVQARAQTLEKDGPFTLFATGKRVGLTSRGRAFSVSREPATVQVKTWLSGRGSDSHEIVIGGRRVAIWFIDNQQQERVVTIAKALAAAIGTTAVETLDMGNAD